MTDRPDRTWRGLGPGGGPEEDPGASFVRLRQAETWAALEAELARRSRVRTAWAWAGAGLGVAAAVAVVVLLGPRFRAGDAIGPRPSTEHAGGIEEIAWPERILRSSERGTIEWVRGPSRPAPLELLDDDGLLRELEDAGLRRGIIRIGDTVQVVVR